MRRVEGKGRLANENRNKTGELSPAFVKHSRMSTVQETSTLHNTRAEKLKHSPHKEMLKA